MKLDITPVSGSDGEAGVVRLDMSTVDDEALDVVLAEARAQNSHMIAINEAGLPAALRRSELAT